MASDNPFDTGVLKTPTDDADQLVPPPLDVEVETDPEPVKKPTRKGSAQVQPPTEENVVDDDLAGENSPADGGTDAVDGEIVDGEASSTVAVWQEPAFPSREPEWAYDTIEYGGFVLNVHIPKPQALTGFSMATGELVDDLTKQKLVSKFVQLHFSKQSYDFLLVRMMDPLAEDFGEETFADIMKVLIETAGERAVEAAKAKAELVAAGKKSGKR